MSGGAKFRHWEKADHPRLHKKNLKIYLKNNNIQYRNKAIQAIWEDEAQW